MKQSLLMERYPIFTLQIDKAETPYGSVDEIIAYFKERVDAHPSATFIAVFDHYAHTRALSDGRIGSSIQAAKNIVFCFGLTLPDPRALALRPRSIGVAETKSGFLVTFMEAPMPVANAAIEEWAKGLRDAAAA
jgi:hypothetical protein